MPSISVIVPVYKVEAYLRRCVDSILNQTFRDFELILVDDGSPDRCGEMCEEYAANYPYVHVIHQENGGLSAARNTGIDWAFANSDSKWLAFVDSDDWVAPEYLEMLCRAVKDTGARIGACDLMKTDGKPLPQGQAYAVETMEADSYYCSGTVHGGITAVAWNKLYQKLLFSSIRYPKGKLHEDEFTTYRLIYEAGQVAVVPAKLYGYFQNAQGIMQAKWSPKRLHGLEAVEQQMAFARKEGLQNLLEKAVEQYVYNISLQLPQAEADYHKLLQKKLRSGLKDARKLGKFRFGWETLWVYELAYPVKPVWWLVFKIKARIGR